MVLIGTSGSGKSTFARKHFLPTEVVSSDYCRGLVSDDENDLAATNDAFEVLHFIAARRLARGKLTVVDATNVQPEARRPLVELARQYHCLPVAIVFDLPEKVCQERNRTRPERTFGPHVIHQQGQQLHRSLRRLKAEGFRHIFILSSAEEVEAAVIGRQPLWNDRRQHHGPFDIIGDVHGCFDELIALLTQLEYEICGQDDALSASHPDGRKVIFLGDLADRGPKIVPVLRLVTNMVEAGHALCVPGNHDTKLVRALRGRHVQIAHGLAESLAQLAEESKEFGEQVAAFLDGLVSHYVLDDGKLVVAHAGMREEMQGRGSRKVRDFALYGETTGETDEFGLPVRYPWARDYRGSATVVYGHTPVGEPEWVNRTINIDTGCVFGGTLTALRYPEKELVSVPAFQMYYEPVRPLTPAETEGEPSRPDDVLDIQDVLGKRIISTRLHRNVTSREENARAALEVMSRFAADPRWLIYLPPTMSPCETSTQPGLLEHPAEAFAYYRRQGVSTAICEEKHMGSRAVVIVCRDADTARKRFRVTGDGTGICYTRTGRRFFGDSAVEAELLARARTALSEAGFWEEFGSDWFCLDCELMPWSAKAQELLREQYAAVGAAAQLGLADAVRTLEAGVARDAGLEPLLAEYRIRTEAVSAFIDAYRRYCWPVRSIRDLKLAPFHLMASEGTVHVDKDHRWHMDTLARLCAADAEVLLRTEYRTVDLADQESEAAATRWWEEMTGRGSEGMVVKPSGFVVTGRRGLVQTAVKCRGREYLRIIYGPEYAAPQHLERLRDRKLSAKRSLALREFALGVEALERFVKGEPLYHVHECVFGVLAMESEPVDPRL